MLIILNFVSAAPALPPSSCKKVDDAWETCQEEHSRTAEPILQESMEEFSMKVFSHLRGIHPFENLLLSPISIFGILSHLLLGRRGLGEFF